MAQVHFIATAKESLVLVLPHEAHTLGIRPGSLVGVTVDTDTVEPSHSEAPPVEAKQDHQNCPSALGRYAFVAGGSEDFAKEKQAEIEREDRPRG